MKKLFLILTSTSLLATTASRADVFGNIQDWVGTGTNQAAFEIDWANGATNAAMIWGYRWNGSATGEQMFDTIVATDPRLYAEVSEPGEFGSYGTSVFGLGFHPSGDQNFQLSPSLSFNSQHLVITDSSTVNDSRTAVNPADFWQEGWYTAGYWNYWVSTDSELSTNYTDWVSGGGMTSRVLTNGDVDGWNFDYGFAYPGATPSVPIDVLAIPEPATWALLACGGLLVVRRQYKRLARRS
jgi:hypothetical protein